MKTLHLNNGEATLPLEVKIAAWKRLTTAQQTNIKYLSYGYFGGFQQSIRKRKNPLMAIAYHNNLMVGWVAAFGAEGDFLDNKHVRHFYVDPNYRNRGIAKALFVVIQNYTKQQHENQVGVYIYERNSSLWKHCNTISNLYRA